jgi:hypothetical protein
MQPGNAESFSGPWWSRVSGFTRGCSRWWHALFVQFRDVADALAGRPHLLAGELPLAHGRAAADGPAAGRARRAGAGVFPQLRVIAHAGAWGFQLHFLTAMLAYSLFTLSALHAIFMGFAERKLHQRAITKSLTSLPPILTMEALLFRMITVAFLLLTVALLSGVMFSEAIFGKAMVLDHKTLFAFASWAIFAALLVGRRIYGWRGRIALRWTLAGFHGAAAGLYGQPL